MSVEERDHAVFKTRAADSVSGVQLIADRLRKKNFYEVFVPELQIADLYKDRMAFIDDGDIHIKQVIEVKHRRNITFTCAKDYPYGDMIICSKHSWDRKTLKPAYYYIINRVGTHAAVIAGTTNKTWIVKALNDRAYENGGSQFYCASIDQFNFIKL